MSALLSPLVIVVFTAISFNAADHLDGDHMIRVKDLPACYALQASYEKAMDQENQANAPAFRMRWSTDCKVMVLSAQAGHV